MVEHQNELFSERVPAGSRTYFFDVKESQDGDKYLVISDSRNTDSGYEYYRVMVFEEFFEDFQAGYAKAMAFLDLPEASSNSKTYSVDKIRKQYPRAYKKWSPGEDEALEMKFDQWGSC